MKKGAIVKYLDLKNCIVTEFDKTHVVFEFDSKQGGKGKLCTTINTFDDNLEYNGKRR